MSYVAGNKDPYGGDTTQQHESHVQPTGTVYLSPSQIPAPAATGTSPFQPVASDYDSSLQAWTCDPFDLASAATNGSGQLVLSLFRLSSAITITTLATFVATAGGTLTAGQNLIGIYSAGASSASLVVSSGDMTTAFGTVGLKKTTVASTPLSAGLYYFAFLSVGTTAAQPPRRSAGYTSTAAPAVAAGLYRNMLFGSQTNLPASLAYNTSALQNYHQIWGAVG